MLRWWRTYLVQHLPTLGVLFILTASAVVAVGVVLRPGHYVAEFALAVAVTILFTILRCA
jgi:hypothetical protein